MYDMYIFSSALCFRPLGLRTLLVSSQVNGIHFLTPGVSVVTRCDALQVHSNAADCVWNGIIGHQMEQFNCQYTILAHALIFFVDSLLSISALRASLYWLSEKFPMRLKVNATVSSLQYTACQHVCKKHNILINNMQKLTFILSQHTLHHNSSIH